jgi:hypothetical protein
VSTDPAQVQRNFLHKLSDIQMVILDAQQLIRNSPEGMAWGNRDTKLDEMLHDLRKLSF